MNSGQGDEDKNLARLSQPRNGNSMHVQCMVHTMITKPHFNYLYMYPLFGPQPVFHFMLLKILYIVLKL